MLRADAPHLPSQLEEIGRWGSLVAQLHRGDPSRQRRFDDVQERPIAAEILIGDEGEEEIRPGAHARRIWRLAVSKAAQKGSMRGCSSADSFPSSIRTSPWSFSVTSPMMAAGIDTPWKAARSACAR